MQLIGHRGARGEAPENTLGGFQYIIDLSLKAVEFDVRLLQDHQLAVIHDDDFFRTTGQQQKVQHTSTIQLAQTDNRIGWSDWKTNEPTPTLPQVLNLIQHFDHIEVEVKAVNDEHEAHLLVEKLHQALAGWQHNATITSFDLKILDALQQQNSTFKRGLLVELPLGEVIIQIAKQYGCSRIGLKDAFVSAELIHLIKAAQLECSVWTVNDIERAKYLATLGIDGLITDIPRQMIAAEIEKLHL
jgi:glycerophosphoryl diester phosphodiesterase